MGEAIAEQQLAQHGKGYKVSSVQTDRAYGVAAGDVSGLNLRVDQLKEQVEQLKSVKQNLEKQPGEPLGFGYAQTATLPGQPDPRSSVSGMGGISASDLGRKVSEKAKDINARADQAVDLARQGRIAEAQSLLASLERDEKAVSRAALSLTKAGAGTLGTNGTYLLSTTVISGGVMHLESADLPKAQAAAATDARRKLDEARQAVANKAKELGTVNFNVEDIVQARGDEKKLAEFVAVGSRNIFVDPASARAAGIEWKNGANGVTYALVNEGQLLGLMDIEQAAPSTPQAAAPQGDVRQDAVVGTAAVLANGGLVAIDRAADESNTLSYNGNTVRVGHEDYLLVSNGGYLTAVKSGRMRHWTAEAAPVRFPGVPAVVAVPVVGRTVKFEKTLVDASDTMELAADYSWQGDEK